MLIVGCCCWMMLLFFKEHRYSYRRHISLRFRPIFHLITSLILSRYQQDHRNATVTPDSVCCWLKHSFLPLPECVRCETILFHTLGIILRSRVQNFWVYSRQVDTTSNYCRP